VHSTPAALNYTLEPGTRTQEIKGCRPHPPTIDIEKEANVASLWFLLLHLFLGSGTWRFCFVILPSRSDFIGSRAASHRPLGCIRTRLCGWRPFALALLVSDLSAKGGDISALFSAAFLGTSFTILIAMEFGWERREKRSVHIRLYIIIIIDAAFLAFFGLKQSKERHRSMQFLTHFRLMVHV
jgi:hypothetical protein